MIQKIKKMCNRINNFGIDPDSDVEEYIMGHIEYKTPHSKTLLTTSLGLAAISIVAPFDFGLGIFCGLVNLGYPINYERYLPRLRRLKYNIIGRLKC